MTHQGLKSLDTLDPACILLAAGCSSRLGRPKQLVPFRDKTLLEHAISTLQEAGMSRIWLVLGAYEEKIRREINLRKAGVDFLSNPHWEKGMGTSISCAVSALEALHPSSYLFMLCDQPRILPSDLRRLLQAYKESHVSMASSYYEGSMGVPAVFSECWQNELKALPPEKGAKHLMKRYPAEVVSVELSRAAFDVDRPSDLRCL